jgi:hypothetical protein
LIDLRRQVDQLEQDQSREKWRSQAMEDNQRQLLQQNYQFSTYSQVQLQHEPCKFSFCENCGENGHMAYECGLDMNYYERPCYEMPYTTNHYNQPYDYQLQNECEFGWNDHHNFSHLNNERVSSQLSFESTLNCEALNNVSSQSHGKTIKEMEDEFINNFEFDKANEVERMTYEKLIQIRFDEQALKTQENNEDRDDCYSFNITQNSCETNDNGKEEYALVFVGESEMKQFETKQLNESSIIFDIAPKRDYQALGQNPNPLSKEVACLTILIPRTWRVSYKSCWKNYDALAGRKVKVKRDVKIHSLGNTKLFFSPSFFF